MLHVLVHTVVQVFGCGRSRVGREVVVGRLGASLCMPVTELDFFFQTMQAYHEQGECPAYKLSCEYLAKLYIVPHEFSHTAVAAMDVPADAQLTLTQRSHATGHGARARRAAARAAAGLHEVPPPSSYHQ